MKLSFNFNKITSGLSLKYLNWRMNSAPNKLKKQYNETLNKKEIALRKIQLLSYPLTMQIGTNISCNLKCVYCKHSDPIVRVKIDNLKLDEKEISFSIIDKLMDVIPYISRVNLKCYGEPLLFTKLPDLLDQYKKLGTDNLEVTTNGTLLNKQNTKLIVQSGVQKVYIALDAPDKAMYESLRQPVEFQRVEENINLLNYYKRKLESKTPVLSLIMRISLRNFKQISPIIDFAANHNIEEVIYQLMERDNAKLEKEYIENDIMPVRNELNLARSKANAMNLKMTIDSSIINIFDSEKRIKKSGGKIIREKLSFAKGGSLIEKCSSPFTNIFINVNGDIKPCLYSDIVYGNITFQPFTEIWNSPEAQEIRRGFLGNYIPEGCHDKICSVDI